MAPRLGAVSVKVDALERVEPRERLQAERGRVGRERRVEPRDVGRGETRDRARERARGRVGGRLVDVRRVDEQ